jgi:hypothetical protein
MTKNLRMSRIAFVAICGLSGLLTEPPAALAAGCNSGNVANTDLLSSANCQANALGVNSLAVGNAANANGTGAVAVGNGAFANPFNGETAIGSNSLAGSTGATAVGSSADAQGVNTTVMGSSSFTGGSTNATAIGASAKSLTSGINATLLGEGATVGTFALPTFDNATAIGQGTSVQASNATAVGQGSSATALGATALGQASVASGSGATAIGTGSSAGFANSAAIGNGVTTTRANQVAVGTAANTYTLAGVTSAASTAAQTGPTKVVTTDAFGNLAAASFTPQDISTLQSNVGILQQDVSILQQQMKQAFEGTAIAIAMGGASLPADKRFAISTNWGNFRGQNAVGVAAQFRLTDYAVANLGVGGGFAQGGIGSRAGVTFAW